MGTQSMSKSIKFDMPVGTSKEDIIIKKEIFLELLDINHGSIMKTLRELNLSRSIFRKWRDEDPEFKKKSIETTELIVDLAEDGLIDNLIKKKEKSILFALQTKGMDRGYGTVVSIQHQHRVNFFIEGVDDDTIQMINVNDMRFDDIDDNK